MSISVRLSPEEKTLFQDFAKLHGISVSELIRRSVMEQIEEAYDLKVLEDYEANRGAGKIPTRPIEELRKELNL